MPGATNGHSIPGSRKACRSMLTPLAAVHHCKRAIGPVAWLTRRVNRQIDPFGKHINNLVSEWSSQLRIPVSCKKHKNKPSCRVSLQL